MRHAIVELEEGAVTLTVVDVTRRSAKAPLCFRMPVTEMHEVALGNTLRALLAEAGDGIRNVHVLLGDRRIHHFVTEVPSLDVEDLRALIIREALRVGGLRSGARMLARARVLHRVSRGRLRIAVTALEATVWESLSKAFTENGLKVASLWSIEECLARAIGRRMPSRTAIIDFSAARARFVTCHHGAPVQVRRFMIPGLDMGESEGGAMLAAQLALEVPRTLRYLEEIGCERPQALMLSHRMGMEDSELGAFADDGMTAFRFDPEIEVAEGQSVPGMATLGLARWLPRHRRYQSLLDGVTLRMPTSPMRILTGIAAAVIGVAASGGAALLHGELAVVQQQLMAAQGEVLEIDRQIDEVGLPAPEMETLTLEAERTRTILDRRRPVSRALADVSTCVPPGVRITALTVSSEDQVVLEGGVEASTRLAALSSLGDFVAALRKIGYFAFDDKEEVSEVDGVINHLHFRFQLGWRMP